MFRSALTDHLQACRFWLTDAGPFDVLGLPVLSPQAGFSAITAPELTLDTQTIPDGDRTRTVIKGASVGAITLSRGASLGDMDFYRWISSARTGKLGGVGLSGRRVGGVTLTPRRNLVLIQFFRGSPLPEAAGAAASAAALTGLLGAAGGANAAAGITGLGLGIVGAGLGGGPAVVYLPARAWILRDAIPTRYKAGSDFDASASEVSIMELELAVEDFEEVSL